MGYIEKSMPIGGLIDGYIKVVGGISEPINPKTGTIWINTDIPVGEYQFNKYQPAVRAGTEQMYPQLNGGWHCNSSWQPDGIYVKCNKTYWGFLCEAQTTYALTPGETYTLTGYAQGAANTPNREFVIATSAYTTPSTGNSISIVARSGNSTSDGWKKVSFTVPSNGLIRIALGTNYQTSEGAVYYTQCHISNGAPLQEGDIWFRCNTNSTLVKTVSVTGNMVNNFDACYQYVGGTWVSKSFKVY